MPMCLLTQWRWLRQTNKKHGCPKPFAPEKLIICLGHELWLNRKLSLYKIIKITCQKPYHSIAILKRSIKMLLRGPVSPGPGLWWTWLKSQSMCMYRGVHNLTTFSHIQKRDDRNFFGFRCDDQPPPTRRRFNPRQRRRHHKFRQFY